MIKAIFFDIDGTLVSFKTHQIPTSTKQALAELKKKGIQVFIATGRPFAAINNLGNCVFDGYITVNGAYCMTGDRQPIFRQPISPVEIASFLRYQEQHGAFPCMAATEDEIFINFVNDDVESVFRLINFPFPQIKSLEKLNQREVFQLVAFFKEDKQADIMDNALHGCEAARWNPLFADIIAKGISKQVGIDKVLEHHGLKLEETMAFGDGGNDLQMLSHVPTSIAMGNAVDAVKQVATYVTDSVDENGVWNALKHFGVI